MWHEGLKHWVPRDPDAAEAALNRVVPRLHVEATVDVDAEIAALLDEQEARST